MWTTIGRNVDSGELHRSAEIARRDSNLTCQSEFLTISPRAAIQTTEGWRATAGEIPSFCESNNNVGLLRRRGKPSTPETLGTECMSHFED